MSISNLPLSKAVVFFLILIATAIALITILI